MSTSHKSNPDEIVWDGADESKSWWSKRSGLEKKLIISLVTISVLSVGILVYMGLKPAEGINTETTCSAPDCLVPASELINRLDSTVDPCDDFFKFACGKHIKNTVKEDIEKELLNILKTPEADNDHYMLKNEKRLFQTCINESELEDESLPIIQSMIRELNEWPVVVGIKWRERQFDWVDTLVKLRKSGYHDTMILSVDKPDSSNSVSTIQIAPGSTTYVNKEHIESYVKYMSSVAELFGAEPHRAEIEMEKVSDFMEKLNEISDIYWKCNNSNTSIREFEDEYDGIEWLKLINAFVYPQKVGKSDYGEVPCSEYMDAFTTIMSKTSKRIQANYIIWSIIEKLIPFMPKSFRDLEANYTCAINRNPTENDREKFCQFTVANVFIPTPSVIIYTRNHLTKEIQDQVNTLFNNVKAEVMILLENLAWIAEDDKSRLIEKLNDTSAVIGMEWDFEDDSVFEKYEPSTNRRPYRGSFLNMYLNRNKQRKSFITSIIENGLDITMNAYTTGTLPLYYYENNKLELPLGMFQKFFYKPEGPMYLTYSAFGKAIAQELILTLLFKSQSDWTKDSLLHYHEHAKCIFKTTDDVASIHSQEDLSYVENGILANIAGLRATYNLYQKYLEENGEEAIPLGIDRTSNQLFWIASVLYECYESEIDPLQSHLQKIYQNNVPFINNEEFSKDFGCSEESKMNKPDKCQIE